MVSFSVVMSVYNGAAELPATLDSILGQTMRDFEVVVVDDGSGDATPSILVEYAARDGRIRVLSQANSGLTRALIRGCGEARADVIARHDCGDRSHPERFARQLALLEEGHVLVSCAARFSTSEGDELYVARAEGEEVRRSLLADDAARIHALPHHGSAMFRRDAYVTAGGYRPQFRLAQDLDLWLRIAQLGTIAILPDVLYEATLDARSLSGLSRTEQVRLTALAIALRDGGDASLLDEAARIVPARASRSGEAAALYFIGKCLLQQRNAKWRRYLCDAVARNPWHWRAWVGLLLGRFGVR
ncbi:MAG TPA: glycosyltransferase family 2 protein [Thermoanaerobaculia bacterium]|nr:glycosyltransferase family 2 protein [Thermoanaerobaculia bacterium]